MYVPVYTTALAVRFSAPPLQPNYNLTPEPITKNVGDNIAITAISNNAATLKLYFNGAVIQTATAATTISANPPVVAGGLQKIVAEANDGTTDVRDTISFFVSGGVTVAPLPSGVTDGINYYASTDSVTLVLFAPNKNHILVLGDFNSWTQSTTYEMNQTPDGQRYWITIKGLTSGTEYAYQYLIDDSIQVADYNTEKVLR